MRRIATLRAAAICSCVILQRVRAEGEENGTETTTHSSSIPCGIWLAPSTIPGAGLGMFAGRDFDEGEDLQEVGDVVIPVVDMVEHQASDDDYTFLFDEYTWSAVSLGVDHEGRFEVNCVSPGFGAAANSFLPLVNVEEGNPDNGAAGLHRSRDPGAGAFSTYHNRRSTAKTVIKSGEELFVDYGNTWFESRPMLGPCALYHDLDLATKLFAKYDALRSELNSTLSHELLADIWDTFVNNTSFNDSRVLGAFHHDDQEELNMLQQKSMSEIRRQQSIRTTEWLEQHGTCADHIQAGPSTIKQAGRGAFATRFLPEGTIVTQMPLVHISDRKRLDMYNMALNDDGDRVPDPEEGKMGTQLLVNYCMGHADSSLLLCPYGPMTGFVNHGSGQKANVKLQWGSPERGNHMPELLEGSLEQLEKDATAKLAMDLVATRDIEEGDEVFLDYGDEWEEAWNKHVEKWKPVSKAESYISAGELDGDATKRLQTVFEQLEKPIAQNIDLTCNSAFRNKLWKRAYLKDDLDSFLGKEEGEMFACDILRYQRIDGTYFYTVALYDEDNDDRQLKIEEVPREAIRFYDRPYTTDMFLENAFRHDIRITDDIFPLVWRNLKEDEHQER